MLRLGEVFDGGVRCGACGGALTLVQRRSVLAGVLSGLRACLCRERCVCVSLCLVASVCRGVCVDIAEIQSFRDDDLVCQ